MPSKVDKKLWLLIAISVLLMGFFIWLAFGWQLENIKSNSDKIQEEQLSSEVSQERKQKIMELGKELEDIESNANQMNAMLINKNNAVPFLKVLEKIAGDTNNSIKISVVDISKVVSQTVKKPVVQESDSDSAKTAQEDSQTQSKSPAQTVKQDFSNQLGFSLEVEGSFTSAVDFFTKLENIPYFFQIYNFKILPSESQLSQTAGGGVTQNTNLAGQSSQNIENEKKIKSVITIGVYTNGTK
jgi:hypothetical protein